MSKASMTLVGADELQKVLAPLAPKIAKAIFKKAAVKFAGQTRDAVRGVVGVDKGALRRGTKSKSTRSGGAVVYVDASATKGGRANIGHIHRKGTKKRATKRGANRGVGPANPRVDQVIESQAGRFLDQVGVVVLNEIKAQVAKAKAR